MDGRIFKQHWTIKKVLYYFIYLVVGKYLPDELGPIGRLSQKIRRRLCRPLFLRCEGEFNIGRGADFGNGSSIILRDYAGIGLYASLESGGRATITIGRHVMMGRECIILNQNHNYLEEGFNGFVGKDVIIDDYAWIGHRVTILPGVTIGKHAIIGAGAVVSRDVPDYGIAVGVPARVIRYRKEQKKK